MYKHLRDLPLECGYKRRIDSEIILGKSFGDIRSMYARWGICLSFGCQILG